MEPERTERDQSGKHLAMRCDAVLHWLTKAHTDEAHPLQVWLERTVHNPSLAVRRERDRLAIRAPVVEAGRLLWYLDCYQKTIAKPSIYGANSLFSGQKCWRSRRVSASRSASAVNAGAPGSSWVQQAFQRRQMGA